MGTRRNFIRKSAFSVAGSMFLPALGLAETDLLRNADRPASAQTGKTILMDMVHHNPGLPKTESKFLSPQFLKSNGYDAKVFFLFEAAQFGINWQDFDPAIFPEGTASADWVNQHKQDLTVKYTEAKNAGLAVYCMLDMLVFPTNLVKKYKADLCNEAGKIDIKKPFTAKATASLLNQMFDTFPQLEGLVIRTGETYLQDAPYYTGGSPVVSGMEDHVALLNVLRLEVCQKRNKNLFYRTWDIGQFHSLPKYYLQVTNAIQPHPKLCFSIKHTMVDFWRMAIAKGEPALQTFNRYWLDEASKYGVPFNPCLGIGRHRQIVEVQCQREYEGKAAHPNYIAAGVINRFTELQNLQAPQCLNELKHNSLFAGVWTWSRGGGWGGPYVKNEFWPEMNAYVLARWAKSPAQSEEKILARFASAKGLPAAQFPLFRKLCLLSAEGVFEGKYSAAGDVYVNWTRDDSVFGLPVLAGYFDTMIKNDTVNNYIAEKFKAAKIWQDIEQLSKQLQFANPADTYFVQASCTYGRLKFAFYAAAWQVMLNGYQQQKQNRIQKQRLQNFVAQYDEAWNNWQDFTLTNAYSPTIYKLDATLFGKPIGIKQTVDEIRKLVS